MFHDVKGKNITFDKNGLTAAWNPVQSGGLTFTEKPITAGEPVTLTLQGTGGIALGILHTDPATLLDNVPDSASNLVTYHFLNDVKIHKRTCTMNIRRDDKTQEIFSSYGGGQYKQDIYSNLQYWLVADVKYGEIELKLENSDCQNQRYEFSDNCGSNIKKLNDPSIAKSQAKSPASICFLREPVSTGNLYVLHCTPMPYQGTIPGRYYILIRYTNQTPEEFQEHNEEKFDVSKQNGSGPSTATSDWYQIEKFEKEDCTGNPIIVEYTGDSFRYKTASGKHNIQICSTNCNSANWLVFELYGVSARLEIINVSDRRGGEVHVDGGSSIVEGGSMTAVATCNVEDIPSDTPKPVRHPDTPDTHPIEDPVLLERAIQKNFTRLRDSFNVNEFIDYMFESDMLTFQDFQMLGAMSNENQPKATKSVLMNLSARPVSKKFMLMALEKTKQSFLATLFFPDEEKE